MRRFIVSLLHPVLRRVYARSQGKSRFFTHKGLIITVDPGVFHPGWFFSTKILMRFLEKQPLAGASFLELGCGSGAVALYASKLGAHVTAVDINPAAVECTRENALANGIEISVLQSDLFGALPQKRFQKIVINPPYYPKNPTTDAEKAFFCGEDFGYFQKLFAQLPNHLERGALIWMILSEDCDLPRIKGMATSAGFSWERVLTATVWGEENFIFLLKRDSN